MSGPTVPDAYRALIDSSRVSTGTRTALQARGVCDDPAYHPVAMTPAQLEILRAVIRRLVPQPAAAGIDLAARLDALLGNAQGDGWRYAMLPEDRTAYGLALSVLDDEAHATQGGGFAGLTEDQQDGILMRAASGGLDGGAARLDGARMQLWFKDMLTDAVKLYVAHPATLARIGYSGIGYGGDGEGKPGFDLIGLGERESWEPVAGAGPDAR